MAEPEPICPQGRRAEWLLPQSDQCPRQTQNPRVNRKACQYSHTLILELERRGWMRPALGCYSALWASELSPELLQSRKGTEMLPRDGQVRDMSL